MNPADERRDWRTIASERDDYAALARELLPVRPATSRSTFVRPELTNRNGRYKRSGGRL